MPVDSDAEGDRPRQITSAEPGMSALQLALVGKVELDGRTYHLHPLNAHQQRQFVVWARRQPSITPRPREWGDDACCAAVRTPAGLMKLVSLSLAGQGITPEAAEMVAKKYLADVHTELLASIGTPIANYALESVGLPSDFLNDDLDAEARSSEATT